MRAIIPRPNKAPRCVQKRPRISHAKLQPPFAFTITLGSPMSNPWPTTPTFRIDGPRKRSHLNANNTLIVRATRGCSHRKRGFPSLPARTFFLPLCITILSYRVFVAPSVYPFLRHFLLSSHDDLCPRTMSFRDIIIPYRNVTSRSSLSSRNSRRRAATIYDDNRCHDTGGYGKGNHLIFMSLGHDPFLRTTLQ